MRPVVGENDSISAECVPTRTPIVFEMSSY
jgi:hypothetical protein